MKPYETIKPFEGIDLVTIWDARKLILALLGLAYSTGLITLHIHGSESIADFSMLKIVVSAAVFIVAATLLHINLHIRPIGYLRMVSSMIAWSYVIVTVVACYK